MASIIDERGFNQGFELTRAQRLRLRRRAEAIAAECTRQTPDVHIMEIGCGTGELAAELVQLTNTRVTGVDLSIKFIEQAKALHCHEKLSFIVADLSKTGPASEQDCYDYIVGNGILHHLYHHLDSVLPSLRRWLRPGGRLIFWEPNLMNPYIWLIFSFSPFRRMAKLEPDEMAFTPSFITEKLLGSGFTHVTATTRDFLLPNTPDILITPVIRSNDVFEKTPGFRCLAQSIFIVADVG